MHYLETQESDKENKKWKKEKKKKKEWQYIAKKYNVGYPVRQTSLIALPGPKTKSLT